MRTVKLTAIVALGIVGAGMGIGATAAPPRKHKGKHTPGKITQETTEGVLWRYPTDIATRNLYYGPGGRKDAPSETTFTFVKEDLKGTNPKFVVRDASGTRWKIKLGPEARPEVATTRLVWAAGYFTNEDYFLPRVRVRNMPVRVRRGRKYVEPGGVVL